MARCGSTIMLYPVLRWGCDWTSVKLLNPVSKSRSSSVLKGRAGLISVSCFSLARRPGCNLLFFPGRVPTNRVYQRHISSAFDQLNDEQKAAVQAQEDCVRVVAGPGSGKTLVLTHRIAHLIKNRGVDPSNVLCLTFTNKAKDELQQRLGKLLGDNVLPKLTIGTFHSVCVRILRENARKEEVGVNEGFVIYDDLDSQAVVKKMLGEMADEGIDIESTWQIRHLNLYSEESHEVPMVKKKKDLVQRCLKRIGQVKEHEMKNFIAKQNYPYKLLEMPQTLKSAMPEFNRYQSMLRSYNAVDFDDLIFLTVRMLYQRSDLRQKYQNRWSCILADEFQDTDWAQYVFVRLLCATNQKLFVVGDVDQAIYGWRGADYMNMLDLERHFQGLTTFELRRNYRSSSSILKLASEVMNRSNRPSESLKPLKLRAMKPKGAPVTIVQCLGTDEEASYVLKKISDLVDGKQASYGSFAILYRTRLQGHAFQKWCVASQIPYKISGSTDLLSYKEVKDLRAYLQLIWNPEDGVALDRVINIPPRGLGPKTLKSVKQWASDLNISFPQALQKIVKEETSHKDLGIGLKARNSLLEFCKLQEDLLRQSEDSSVSMLIQEVIDRTRMSEYHKRFDGNFVKRASHMHLLQDEKKLNAVKLSTLHAAKGQEFDHVFITGVEEGNLPFHSSDLEEERRLFYVGVTRARKELVITCRQMVIEHGGQFHRKRMSQFLQLPLNLYKIESVTDCSHETHRTFTRWS